MDKDNIMHQDTVALDPQTEELVILDQTRLPGQTVFLRLSTAEAIYQAIYTLQVRGAPAIGVAAAIGIYAVCRRMPETDYETFAAEFERIRAYLVSARPTAVNLAWALEQMAQVVREHAGCPVAALKDRLRERALELRDQDIQVCRAIGEYGLTLIQNGDGILTHCNAGQLATVRYGTALAPIHVGREQGMQFRVFTDETRPLLQGARLSAYELFADGVNDITRYLRKRTSGTRQALAMDFMEARRVTEPSAPEVEPAREDDLDEIFDCAQRFVADCGLLDKPEKESFRKVLDSIRVIRADGKIVSMARIAPATGDDLRLVLVYTRDEYRGRGYARKVVNSAKNEILASGKRATLNVDRKNPVSYHLYLSLGFERMFSQGEFRRVE